jgi:hypothetical protein
MKQPKTIPNPLYCDRCQGRGYLVVDAEWEPIAVECPDCAIARARRAADHSTKQMCSSHVSH